MPSYPSLKEWKELYRSALEFKELKPWDWMWDTDLCGVQNPKPITDFFKIELKSVKRLSAVEKARRSVLDFFSLKRAAWPIIDKRSKKDILCDMENNLETIKYEVKANVAQVILNRPQIHNAFNDKMIEELTMAFEEIEKNQDVRVVVLSGAGRSFCAGADLNWMRRIKDYSYEENLKESIALSEMLYKIYTCVRPTIARVQGYAIGGGFGLVTVCDLAIASMDAKFSFSEVKLGLIPACISPYVVRKCGEARCREFFLTGERMSAEKAFNAGLVNIVVPDDALDKAIEGLVNQLLSSGPEAIKKCKELLRTVPNMKPEEFKRYTAELISQLRVSEEAQEGMSAFLQKRKPKWSLDSNR